jgi:hypothetical protein
MQALRNALHPFRAFTLVAVLLMTLSGCATSDQSAQYELKDADPKKGIIVGTVFERSVFTPHGAKFQIHSPTGELIAVHSHGRAGNKRFAYEPPKVPKGVGATFALQLPPGKYKVVAWGLDYGRSYKMSGQPPVPVEFDVEAGKTIYLGRLDANRFLEIGSIHDKFAEDSEHLKGNPLLAGKQIENKSLKVKGWWLPNASGKELLEKHKDMGPCEQC